MQILRRPFAASGLRRATENKERRKFRGASFSACRKAWRLRRGLGLDDLSLAAVADRNLARLFRLRNLAHEIDVQEPVLERRALDVDVVGELENTLEGARGDALIEHLAVLLVFGLLARP